MAYRDALEPPGMDSGTAVGGSATSPYAAQLKALYQKYFFRDPTPEELATHSANLSRGNGSLADIQRDLEQEGKRLGLKPPAAEDSAAVEAPARTAENAPRGVDTEKWASGHMSPKYLWKQAQTMFDQKTPEGRAQTLAYVQQQAPQWFKDWTIDGDRLRYTGNLENLHKDFDGYNAFDAWKGSKSGEWGTQWLPIERNGQAYDHFAAARAAQQGAGGGGGAAAAGTDWFTSTVPELASFTNDSSAYTTPQRPDYLQGPYEAPQFQAPGFEELVNDPGYQARLMAGVQARDRMAAARGSLLGGGHKKAIERYAQDYGANEYQNLYGRKFGAFQTNAGLDVGARQMNEGAYQDDVMNAQTQFQNRYRTYRDAIGDRFRLTEIGANATAAGRPS